MSVMIRPWSARDVRSLAHHANNVHIAESLRDYFPTPYTEEDAAFFIRYARHAHSDREWIYAIEVDGEACGCISLTFGHDVYAKSGELGYWLGEQYWGQGITTQAIGMICKKAFAETEIVRIQAEVMANNPASIQVLQKNRFIQEGYFCNRIYKNEKMHDSVLFASFK